MDNNASSSSSRPAGDHGTYSSGRGNLHQVNPNWNAYAPGAGADKGKAPVYPGIAAFDAAQSDDTPMGGTLQNTRNNPNAFPTYPCPYEHEQNCVGWTSAPEWPCGVCVSKGFTDKFYEIEDYATLATLANDKAARLGKLKVALDDLKKTCEDAENDASLKLQELEQVKKDLHFARLAKDNRVEVKRLESRRNAVNNSVRIRNERALEAGKKRDQVAAMLSVAECSVQRTYQQLSTMSLSSIPE